jgi:hypothetical protein
LPELTIGQDAAARRLSIRLERLLNIAFSDNTPSPSLRNAPVLEKRILWGFVALNAVFRLALVGWNGGEYTDGILQITQFERADSFWPPLYTALVWLLTLDGHGLEPLLAGRLVSWISSVLLLFPLWRVARAWAGFRAAVFTLALYTVSAMALRWSVRVMTDMPFLFLFFMSAAELMSSPGASPSRRKRRLANATAWAVLATLARYQGLMLVPLIGIQLVMQWRRRETGRWVSLLAQLGWLSLPAWTLYGGFRHGQQVAARAAVDTWQTLLNYWNIFEMFLYILPYALTLPVFAFVVVGLVRGPAKNATPVVDRRPALRAMLLYCALAVLAAQSAFQSFQTRYLLPILPFLLICGGAGMSLLMDHMARQRGVWRRRALGALIGLTLCWSLAFALTSFFLQRGAFADLFQAGYYIRSIADLPAEARVFSNETFNAEISCVKISFAAGRPVEPIPDLAAVSALQSGLAALSPDSLLRQNALLNLRLSENQIAGLRARAPIALTTDQIVALWKAGLLSIAASPAARPTVFLSREQILEIWSSPRVEELGIPRMPRGSILALHSSYGGFENVEFVRMVLARRYRLFSLQDGVFRSQLTPLLPDIMRDPISHQNPMAWFLRYQTQHFETSLYLVEDAAAPSGEAQAPLP